PDRARPLSASPQLRPDEWRSLGRALAELARFTADHGLHLGFHAHLGTAVATSADVDRLVNEFGGLELTLDTGHLYAAGSNPVEFARTHATRIVHVHLKDVRRPAMLRLRESGGSFLDGVLGGLFTVPGDGAIDYAAFLAVLAEHHYAGWLVVEADQDP